jgi:hypothetical protein
MRRDIPVREVLLFQLKPSVRACFRTRPRPFCHALRRPSGVHTAGSGFGEVRRARSIVRGLRFGYSGRDGPLGGALACREMNARAHTSAPILPRSAEEGHAGYGAASSTPFDGFNNTGFGIPTTRDAREAPDAGGRAGARGVLGALTRTLASGPVVKSVGVLSIFALGAAVGTLSARDAGLGSVAKVRAFGSTRARLSRERLPGIQCLSRAATRVASRMTAGERSSPIRAWRFGRRAKHTSRKRRFSRAASARAPARASTPARL